jgi:hypothetical protein
VAYRSLFLKQSDQEKEGTKMSKEKNLPRLSERVWLVKVRRENDLVAYVEHSVPDGLKD